MTNHIEQLMKEAGVECSTMCKPIGANCKAGCDNCERRKVFYPAFTPEKQLELIKLLPEFKCERQWSGDWVIDYVDVETAKGFRTYSFLFENALAELVTNLIVKKRIDKSEVRRILEDD